jgi:hypothetical protein
MIITHVAAFAAGVMFGLLAIALCIAAGDRDNRDDDIGDRDDRNDI